MPTYRVGLLHAVGLGASASHPGDVYRLAHSWMHTGYYEVEITYKGNEPHHSEEEKLIVPWHNVKYIEIDPFPIVTPDVILYGREED